MEALGLTAQTETDRARTDFIEGAPIELLITAFDLDANGTAIVQSNGAVLLVEMLDISAPDFNAEDAQTFVGNLAAQGSQLLAADVFEMFGQAVQARHGLSLDAVALNAVHAQLP